ncbi:MAG TPA: hypothetical protein VK446_01830 [Methylocystis sp.]|nr:hypothetical protein [Methylocystis sp.]
MDRLSLVTPGPRNAARGEESVHTLRFAVDVLMRDGDDLAGLAIDLDDLSTSARVSSGGIIYAVLAQKAGRHMEIVAVERLRQIFDDPDVVSHGSFSWDSSNDSKSVQEWSLSWNARGWARTPEKLKDRLDQSD